MKRSKKIIISIIAIILVIAIIAGTLLVTLKRSTDTELIGEKFTDNYYDNGWSKEVVAELKNDTIPVPIGFTCEEEIDNKTIIIKDEQGNKYLWVPYDQNIDPTPYLDEVQKYYGDNGIKYNSTESIESMQNYGGFYIGITENKDEVLSAKVSNEEYEKNKAEVENMYKDSVSVSSTLLGYDELVTFLHYRDTLDQELGLQVDKSYELATIDTSGFNPYIDDYFNPDPDYNETTKENRGTLDDDEFISVSKARRQLQRYYLNGKQNNVNNLNNIEDKVAVKEEWEEYVDEVLVLEDTDYSMNVVPIPKGFEYHNGTSVKKNMEFSNGITIVDRNNSGLAYVWVPVKGDFDQVKEDLKTKYEEYYRNTNYNTNFFDEVEEELPDELIQSIAEYGGFYMSEAELGYDDNGELYNKQRGMRKTETGDWYVNIGDYYRRVDESLQKSGITYTDEMRNLTYDNAVSISSGIYDNDDDYGVVSHLTYGAEWDAAMLYIMNYGRLTTAKDNYANAHITLDDSSEVGKYSSSTSNMDGFFNAVKVNGIWGLAGNLAEITQEKMNGHIVLRGGSFADLGSSQPMASRTELIDGNVNNGAIGFRTCLYIKPTGMAYSSGDIYDEIDRIDDKTTREDVKDLIEYTRSTSENTIESKMNRILSRAGSTTSKNDSEYISLKEMFNTIARQSSAKAMVTKIEYYQDEIVECLQEIFGRIDEDDDIYDEISRIDNSTVRTYVKNLVGYTSSTSENVINTTIRNILTKAKSTYNSSTSAEYMDLKNALDEITDQTSVSRMINEIENQKYEIVECLQIIFGEVDYDDEDYIYDEIDNIDDSKTQGYVRTLIEYTNNSSREKINSTINNILTRAKTKVQVTSSKYTNLKSLLNKISNKTTVRNMVSQIEDSKYDIVSALQKIFGTIDDNYDYSSDEDISMINNSSVRSYVRTLIGYVDSNPSVKKIEDTINNILDIAYEEVGDSNEYQDLEEILNDKILAQTTVQKMTNKIASYEDEIIGLLQDIFGTTDEYDDIYERIYEINNSNVQDYMETLVNATENTSVTTIKTAITNILNKVKIEVNNSNADKADYDDLKVLLNEITNASSISRKLEKIEDNQSDIIDLLIRIFTDEEDELKDMINDINDSTVRSYVNTLLNYTNSSKESSIQKTIDNILDKVSKKVGTSSSAYRELKDIFEYDILDKTSVKRMIEGIDEYKYEIVQYLLDVF